MRLPKRVVRNAPSGAPSPDIVLPPYYSGERSRSHARARRALLICVIIFCFLYGLVFAFVAPFLMVAFAVPIAILMAIAIWALPDLKSPPTQSLEWLFFTFIVCLIMWPNYLAIALPGLPWITVSRLIAFPLVFVLLVCVSTSEEFRKKMSSELKAAPYIWMSLVAFVAIQTFSIVVSVEKFDSIQKYAISQVYWTGIFFASCYIFLKPGNVEKWAAMMWITTIPVGLIGIREHMVRRVLWADHIPSILKIQDPTIDLIIHGIKRAYTDIYRVQSTFGNSLGLAEYLAFTTPFVLHFMVRPYSPRIRWAAAASIPFILYIILISGSRLGALGFGLSGLLYLFAWALMKWRRERGNLISSAVVFAYPLLFSGVLAASFVVGKLRKIVWGTGSAQGSTNARIEQMHMGIPLVLKRPWGYGIGQGAGVLNFHNPGGILTIDTYYLLVALDYGVIGFIVYYGMIIISLYYAGKGALVSDSKDREFSFLIPIFIALANFLIIKSIFSQTDNHPLVFMMMGMVVAISYRMKTAPRTGAAAAPRGWGELIRGRSTGVGNGFVSPRANA